MGIASLSLVGKIVRSIDGFCMKWLSKSVILKSQNKYIYIVLKISHKYTTNFTGPSFIFANA